MNYLWVFFVSAFFVSNAAYKIIKGKYKVSAILMMIPSILLILCIIDMAFLCTGGIPKLTDLEKKYYIPTGRISSAAGLTDSDGMIYFTPDWAVKDYLHKGVVYNNMRITYLPCTRTIIKLEQKNIPSNAADATINTDVYSKIYEYSKDSLPSEIASIGVFLVVVLIVKIIRSRKNE